MAKSPSPLVMTALRAAAARTGVSLHRLVLFAALESAWEPAARAPTSSATGLFQFIDQTWLDMVLLHGAQQGLVAEARALGRGATPAERKAILALRLDPHWSALMGALYLRTNAEALRRALGAGRPEWQPDDTDVYIAHFLGPTGAIRFFEACRDTPRDTPATSKTFGRAATANAGIFFHDAAPSARAARTYIEVWKVIDAKVRAKAAETARWATEQE